MKDRVASASIKLADSHVLLGYIVRHEGDEVVLRVEPCILLWLSSLWFLLLFRLLRFGRLLFVVLLGSILSV